MTALVGWLNSVSIILLGLALVVHTLTPGAHHKR
jgi:hypothetical protein